MNQGRPKTVPIQRPIVPSPYFFQHSGLTSVSPFKQYRQQARASALGQFDEPEINPQIQEEQNNVLTNPDPPVFSYSEINFQPICEFGDTMSVENVMLPTIQEKPKQSSAESENIKLDHMPRFQNNFMIYIMSWESSRAAMAVLVLTVTDSSVQCRNGKAWWRHSVTDQLLAPSARLTVRARLPDPRACFNVNLKLIDREDNPRSCVATVTAIFFVKFFANDALIKIS
ncbi:hypothetical protein ElyMa_003926500 [Elysia marginata]|uniref:Uncharacterized protein n=1 Tax=Elysia marginata TaxID=1093978 RepID=A0AAV4FQT8_9GAST|nr:hypothetical protein ElyMa_003926500 [Elysia marginata]